MGRAVPTDDPSNPSAVADLAELGWHFDECRPRLLAMLRRRIDPTLAVRLDAEDILTDVFVEACRRWAKFRAQPGLSAYAWLYGIARDRLIEAWRRETRGRRDLHRDLPWPEQSSVQLGLSLIDPGTNPAAAAERDEVRQRMRQALDLLKEADREILWMRHYDSLSFREVGAVLAVGENAATVRYVRALRRLKDLWQKLYGAGGSQG
jgi:RNA polymerase sigma-70 factor (ECF subfamily)